MRIKQIAPRAWWPPHVDEVRIICPTPVKLASGRVIAALAKVGLEVHSKIRNGSEILTPDYTRGQSLLASDEFMKAIHRQNVFVPLIFTAREAVGSNFPKTTDPQGAVGEHHVPLVRFSEGAVLVDVTAAEFLGQQYKYANTQVLLIPSRHEDIVTNLRSVYGGDWRIKE